MGWIAFAALDVYIGLIILEALIPRFQLKACSCQTGQERHS
jgi:hypothetical protein